MVASFKTGEDWLDERLMICWGWEICGGDATLSVGTCRWKARLRSSNPLNFERKGRLPLGEEILWLANPELRRGWRRGRPGRLAAASHHSRAG